jgi:hypothetical protein
VREHLADERADAVACWLIVSHKKSSQHSALSVQPILYELRGVSPPESRMADC